MSTNKAKGDKAAVVVITGASAGIGRATVREFAKNGAHIALLARGEEGLEATRRAFGKTRRYLRDEGEDAGGWSLLTGVRAWF